jgi:hypothetical protein
MQVYASDGGRADTIGGNFYYNIYLSQDGGQTFINYGDSPATTAIDLPTTPGTHTYQFFYYNSHATSLEMQLDFTGAPNGIDVVTLNDLPPTSFVGFGSYVDGVDRVTLSSYAWTNAGSGPAGAYSVYPGDFSAISPEISGSFTYVSSVIPEPSSILLALIGMTTVGGFIVVSRSRQSRC